MMYDMADGLQSRLADAAVAEYLEAIERGAPPDLEEFLTRHANAGAALREFLADYQAIERWRRELMLERGTRTDRPMKPQVLAHALPPNPANAADR